MQEIKNTENTENYACNEVSRAKYTYWHTIIDLAKASGMPEEDWCRSNCISFRTYRHYDGIFRRQEGRKYFYAKWKQENQAEQKEQVEQRNQAEKEEAKASDKDPMAKNQSSIETQDAAKTRTEKSREDSRYFEIPMEAVKADQDVSLSIQDLTDSNAELVEVEERMIDKNEAEEQAEGKRQKETRKRTAKSAQRKPEDDSGDQKNVSYTRLDESCGSDVRGDNKEGNLSCENISDAITIEAGGIKLSCGSDVDEETLNAVIKAVKRHA